MAATAPAPKMVANRRPEPKQFVFKLTGKNPDYLRSPYTQNLTIARMDEIYWPYKQSNDSAVGFNEEFKKEDVYYALRRIRYVYGEKSIFVDEQERVPERYRLDNGKNRLLDNELNYDRLKFSHAEIRVDAQDTALRNYLWCNNQCENQNSKAQDGNGRRYKQIKSQYKLEDYNLADDKKIELGVQREKAYELAKTVRTEEMIPHAKYLNISFTHEGTDEAKDIKAVQEEYRDYAYSNPEKFLTSFNDPRIKVIHQIKELIDRTEITLLKIPGQAHWVSTGSLITHLPPGENPIEFLAAFALTKPGEEFSNNLRAYNK